MKTKNTVLSGIIAVASAKWIRPVLITLAFSVAMLGMTGCDGSHDSGSHDPGSSDSDRHGNHGNHMHPSGGNN